MEGDDDDFEPIRFVKRSYNDFCVAPFFFLFLPAVVKKLFHFVNVAIKILIIRLYRISAIY